ncbi:MAG: hypothetical protein ACYC2D_08525 [Thiobacillus sp.]
MIAHAEPVRLPQRRLHLVPLRGRQGIPFDPADGVEDQLAARRQRVAPDDVGHAARGAELARHPRGGGRRIVAVARDGVGGRGRFEQHDRGLPGAAGQQLAAGVDQLRRSRCERLHPVSAEGMQIARRQPTKVEYLPRQQCRQQMREQQVAEVVAVEGAEQNRRRMRVHNLPWRLERVSGRRITLDVRRVRSAHRHVVGAQRAPYDINPALCHCQRSEAILTVVHHSPGSLIHPGRDFFASRAISHYIRKNLSHATR